MPPAIKVENLSKSYLVGHNATRTEGYTALLDVFARNGAGQSTLLKILRRITEPTKGRVTINGRVASLLEVGAGFHPELTGREKSFLNGAILGKSRKEIQTVGWAKTRAVPSKTFNRFLRSANAAMAAGPIRNLHKSTSVAGIGQPNAAIARVARCSNPAFSGLGGDHEY